MLELSIDEKEFVLEVLDKVVLKGVDAKELQAGVMRKLTTDLHNKEKKEKKKP